ncbi:MAG: HAMP domain-containing sensor histidine kinase [Clostridium sp.]|nr:HAMP domain-containing sensor histidine kinase [Clostridium sp.]
MIIFADNMLPPDKLFGILALASYIIVAILTIQTLKQRNFILTIYNTSIIILGARLLFVYIFNVFNISEDLLAEDRVFFFLAFFLLLIGLFVKMKDVLTINKGLNRDVMEISKNMRTIQEAEKMRSYFFANLSHEFKTPLNIISATLQLLDKNKTKGNEYLLESYLKYESTLKQNCYRMVRLTNNFVDISKIDAGYMKLEFNNYNIVELVEDITMSVVLYIENKHINIIFDTTDEEIYVKCDPDAIERIVLNLLSNATKFTKENGNIFVDISSDIDYVYITVKDDGPGIDPELREHVFKMFVQGDKSLNRETEGSGIGLSLVYSLAKLHEGDVSISDTETGTEIIVKIPNVQMKNNKDNNNFNLQSDAHQKITEKINIEFSDIYGIR